jgi:hypothetical protein
MYCLTPHQRLRVVLALMTLLVPVSCAEIGRDDQPEPPVVAVPLDEPPPDPATSPPLVGLLTPPPEPLTKPAPPPVAAPPQVAAISPAPPTQPAPRELAGLSMSETETELGRPSAEADRAPAKVWQYRAGDCAVDVYFYLDMARNGFYALHHEARRGAILDETCIRTIQEAGRVR